MTLGGLSSAAVQTVTGRTVSFRDPLIAVDRPIRAVALTVMAGPFMMWNDALSARLDGRIGVPALGALVSAGCIWMLAAGVIVVDLAVRTLTILG